MGQGHKKLEIYQMSHRLAVKVHELSLTLPAIERFEEGSQIRRSSKSIPSNIVEGYALRRYKKEYLQYLFRAYGSAEETIEHLDLLFETKSFGDKVLYDNLSKEYNFPCGKLMRYIQFVDKEFDTPNFIKEPEIQYVSTVMRLEPKTQASNLKSRTRKPNHKTRTSKSR